MKFRYIPFDPQGFRGDRTAVVRLLNPDGAVAKGEKLRIAFLDGHYGFLPVFDGLVPDSGEVELKKLTDRLTSLAPKYRSYWVWLNDRHVGGFDLAAVAKPQRFEIQRALAVGDQAPNLEFIDIASHDRVPLTSLRHLWSQRSESEARSNVERAFSVSGVPTAILLDTDGKIVWYGHPVDDEPPLHERIEQLLARSTAH